MFDDFILEIQSDEFEFGQMMEQEDNFDLESKVN